MLHARLVVSILKMLMDWHSSKQRSCARLFRNDHRCRGVLCAEEVQDFLFSKRWTSSEAFLADGLFRLTTTPFEEEAVIARLFLPGSRRAGRGRVQADGDGVRSPHKKVNKPKAKAPPSLLLLLARRVLVVLAFALAFVLASFSSSVRRCVLLRVCVFRWVGRIAEPKFRVAGWDEPVFRASTRSPGCPLPSAWDRITDVRPALRRTGMTWDFFCWRCRGICVPAETTGDSCCCGDGGG